MPFAAPTAAERLAAFYATRPLPEAAAQPWVKELEAQAAFDAEVALHTDPDAMRAHADDLDRSAKAHDQQADLDERGAGRRSEAGNDHAAREFADRANAHRRLAKKARWEANVLRASAARLIERVAA